MNKPVEDIRDWLLNNCKPELTHNDIQGVYDKVFNENGSQPLSTVTDLLTDIGIDVSKSLTDVYDNTFGPSYHNNYEEYSDDGHSVIPEIDMTTWKHADSAAAHHITIQKLIMNENTACWGDTFMSCSINKIIYPEGTKRIDNCFDGCAFTDVIIPSTTTSISKSMVKEILFNGAEVSVNISKDEFYDIVNLEGFDQLSNAEKMRLFDSFVFTED